MFKAAKRQAPLDRDAAETLAARGLAFLAEDQGRFARFLALTGCSLEDVRRRAQAPELLAAVLEHLTGDESLLLVFCADNHVAPETIASALWSLQGTDHANT
jgi:Protein of unknown function (DUF3572)